MRTARKEGACSKPKGRAALCVGLALALAAALAPAAAIAAGSGAEASQENAAVLAQGALGEGSSVRWTLAANGNLFFASLERLSSALSQSALAGQANTAEVK